MFSKKQINYFTIVKLCILWSAFFPPVSLADYILHVPSTEECPKYTKRFDKNHCKPFVSNLKVAWLDNKLEGALEDDMEIKLVVPKDSSRTHMHEEGQPRN